MHLSHGEGTTRAARWMAVSALVLATSSLAMSQSTASRGPYTPPPNVPDIKTAPVAHPQEPIDPARLAAATTQTPPQREPRPAVAEPQHAPLTHVLYDQSGDGSTWAVGETYKARFAADGFTYVPYLGSDAPRNFPVHFALQSIDIGGKPVALKSATITREADRIVIDRGPVQEVYLLSLTNVEQQFIFNRRPGVGQANIRMKVTSDLAGGDAGQLIEFSNDLGAVRYSRAVTVDANHARIDSPTALTGDGITISIPASVVADGAYPLVVDPIISTYVVSASSLDGGTNDRSPDVAYDATDDGYCIVWERNFSAADGDIYCERYDYNGALIVGSAVAIDASTANWRNPSIANNNNSNEYLIVAEVGAVGSRQVWSRIRAASSNIVGPQVQVSDGAFAGEQFDPDVGGDPFGGASFYCVVWQRDAFATDKDILGRLVTPVTGAVSGGIIFIENSFGTLYTNPSISKSNGTVEWAVAYQFTAGAGNEDIYGARVNWNGAINLANFPIDSSIIDNRNPSVSGLLGTNVMTVYEEAPTTAGDIYARVHNGVALLTGGNLTFFEGVEMDDARRLPVVDSEGDRIVVSYGQQFVGPDWDAYVSTYCYDGSIRVAEQHRNLDYTGFNAQALAVSSALATGGFLREFMLAQARVNAVSGFGEIHGAFFNSKNSCCIADVAPTLGDNQINVTDLLLVIGQWGGGINSAADVNGDRTVNVTDLLAVIGGWGPCP